MMTQNCQQAGAGHEDSSFRCPESRQPIFITFTICGVFDKPQRDLLLLRTVSWLTGVKVQAGHLSVLL